MFMCSKEMHSRFEIIQKKLSLDVSLRSIYVRECPNPLTVNRTKWSSTVKQFVGNLSTNCLSVFDHCVKLALKGLRLKLETQRGQYCSMLPLDTLARSCLYYCFQVLVLFLNKYLLIFIVIL